MTLEERRTRENGSFTYMFKLYFLNLYFLYSLLITKHLYTMCFPSDYTLTWVMLDSRGKGSRKLLLSLR